MIDRQRFDSKRTYNEGSMFYVFLYLYLPQFLGSLAVFTTSRVRPSIRARPSSRARLSSHDRPSISLP